MRIRGIKRVFNQNDQSSFWQPFIIHISSLTLLRLFQIDQKRPKMASKLGNSCESVVSCIILLKSKTTKKDRIQVKHQLGGRTSEHLHWYSGTVHPIQLVAHWPAGCFISNISNLNSETSILKSSSLEKCRTARTMQVAALWFRLLNRC